MNTVPATVIGYEQGSEPGAAERFLVALKDYGTVTVIHGNAEWTYLTDEEKWTELTHDEDPARDVFGEVDGAIIRFNTEVGEQWRKRRILDLQNEAIRMALVCVQLSEQVTA